MIRLFHGKNQTLHLLSDSIAPLGDEKLKICIALVSGLVDDNFV